MVLVRFTIVIITLFFASRNCWPQSPAPTPNPWPGRMLDRMMNGLGDGWDNAGNKISASIFEALTDRELYDLDLNLGPDDEGEVSFRVKRKIYDNKDITDTWTVIDIFEIPFDLPIPFINEVVVSSGNIAVALSMKLLVSISNFRQVSPKNYSDLRDIKDIERELIEAVKEVEKPLDEEEIEESGVEFVSSENPLSRARWSKFFNILTHPLKLPLTKKRIRKMPEGEVSSYFLEGSLQLGASVGWSAVNLPLGMDINVGAGVTTYVNGRFRVSIMREAEDMAQLKVTRVHNLGANVTVGHVEYEQEFFEGFVVLDQTVGRIKDTIVPFSLTLNRNYAKQFDVGYRYDLNNDQAVKAYLKASMGRLKMSEQLSSIEKSGVTKVFTRHQQTISRSRTYKMSLSLIMERAHTSGSSHSKIKITLDGKNHHLFTATNMNYKGYDTLWGTRESRSYNFYTAIDRDIYNSDENKGLVLKIEGALDDSRTTAREIHSYINEMEWATGVKGLFKRPPILAPVNDCDPDDNDCKIKLKKVRYKKTSWFYRVGYNRQQVEKFVNTDEDKMWEIIESSFGVKKGRWSSGLSRFMYNVRNSYATVLNLPLGLFDIYLRPGGRYFMAKKFFKRWKKLKKEKDPQKLTKAVAKMFRTVHFSRELAFIMRRILKDEKVSFFVMANAPRLFGQISKNGYSLADIDTVTTRANDRIEFDRIGARIQHDPLASVPRFELEELDVDTIAIDYMIDKTPPEFVYLRVDKSSNWSKYKNLMRMVIKADDERFGPGMHRMIIKRNEKGDDLKKALSKAIFSTRYATVMMAVSIQDGIWGAVSNDRIRVSRAPKPPGDD